MAASVRSVADAYQKTKPEVDRQCVKVHVVTRAPHETVRLLGGGWSDPTAGGRPDVWIPDSTSWLELARLEEPARALLPEKGKTVATSPVVLAMPQKMAEELGWPGKRLSWTDIRANEGDADYWTKRDHPEWGQFGVVFANPQASSAGADAMLSVVSVAMGTPVTQLSKEMVGENLFVKKVILDLERRSSAIPPSDEILLTELRQADAGDYLPEYASVALVPESAVFAYNRGTTAADGKPTPPKQPLAVSYPTDGPVVQEVPFVTLTSTREDPARSKAAQALQEMLLGAAGQEAFTAEGLRTPRGTNPRLTPDAGFSAELRDGVNVSAGPEARETAIAMFGRLHRRGTSLAVFDTSGSMATVAPGSGGKTRLDVVVEAMETVIGLLADDSNLGVWQFSSHLGGETDHRELVPIGPMIGSVDGVSRYEASIKALRSMKPEGRTGLCDTVLAAFDTLTAHYTPGRPNQVVLLTDGENDDPTGMSVDELVTALEQKFDPERPVRVITIAYGEETDRGALKRISEATGARSYPALDSKSIFQIVIDAVSRDE